MMIGLLLALAVTAQFSEGSRRAGAGMMTGLPFALAVTAQSDWPTYHGGYSLDGVAPDAPPDAPVKLWTFRADHRIEVTPISGGKRIYAATTKGTIHALDLKGKELWKVELGKKITPAPPLFTDGLLIIGGSDGILRALDASNGKSKWTYDVDDTIQGTANRVDLPGKKKGIIVIAQAEGVVHCLDVETGRLAWKTEAVERCDGSAGVGSGRVVMGSCASALHVYSVKQRGKSRDIELGGESQVAGGVAVVGGVAYAGTRGGKLCAVNLESGKIRWTYDKNRSEAFATPAVNKSTVIFASDDGKITALKRDDGKWLWDFDSDGEPGSPVIAGNRVVVSSDGFIIMLNLKTGKLIWKTEIADRITSPAIIKGRILVGADDGTVSLYGKK